MSRTTARVLAVAVTLVGVACGGAPGASTGESTGETSEAILGGTPVANDVLGSPLVCTSTNGGTGCTASLCSGTMIADRWLLTAHHCATLGNNTTGGTATPAGEIYAWLETSPHAASGVAVYLHPTLDVALVELGHSLVDGGGVVRTTPIYTGSSTGLLHKTIYCQGVGYTNLSGSWGALTSADMVVSLASVGSLVLDPNAQGQALYEGDSGAGCFLEAPGAAGNALVSVHSSHESSGLGVSDDLEVGADGFQSWASGVVAQNACSMAGAACGTITDGLGTQVSCGTCGTGDVCSSNACVCAPKHCVVGTTWNQDTCRCQLKCNTPAICCIQAGGEWDGHVCE